VIGDVNHWSALMGECFQTGNINFAANGFNGLENSMGEPGPLFIVKITSSADNAGVGDN
jgi:hypothetical protein